MKQSIINWQTGEPKEEGQYLVTTEDGEVRDMFYSTSLKTWILERHFKVIAWCKLSDIEPYKKEQPDNWTKFNEGETVR